MSSLSPPQVAYYQSTRTVTLQIFQALTKPLELAQRKRPTILEGLSHSMPSLQPCNIASQRSVNHSHYLWHGDATVHVIPEAHVGSTWCVLWLQLPPASVRRGRSARSLDQGLLVGQRH